MLKKTASVKLPALIAIVTTLSACPPGSGPLSVQTEDYWPMALGNSWTFQSKSQAGSTSVWTVTEDLSTANDAAWVIFIENFHNASLQGSGVQHYIWRHDFLVRTGSRDIALQVLAQPDASAHDLPVEIELPRTAQRSNSPRVFLDKEPGEFLYTRTGSLVQLYGSFDCPTDAGFGLPLMIQLPPQSPAVMQLIDNSCEGAEVIEASDLFVQGIGPVDRFNGWLTSYTVN